MLDLIEFFNSNAIYFEQDVSLKEICTFKIGGNAKIICYPNNAKQVSSVVKFCNQNNIAYLTLGRCSNVLFADEGITSLIIKTDRIDFLSTKDNFITVGAGVMLAKASKFSIDNGFKGMEFSYGIPGSVGGALYMNAGAYGGEMSQIVYETEYVDETGEIQHLPYDAHNFGYRSSFFSNKNCIVTAVTFSLEKGDILQSEQLVYEFQTARKTKQPLELQSAGSVFKRPEGYFAGKLIQDCNLRGYTIGGAQVSEKHCGFIVNVDNASCADVKNLIEYIQATVFAKYGVELECELKFICD